VDDKHQGKRVQLVGEDLSVEIRISLKRSSYLGQLMYSNDHLGWMNKKQMNLCSHVSLNKY